MCSVWLRALSSLSKSKDTYSLHDMNIEELKVHERCLQQLVEVFGQNRSLWCILAQVQAMIKEKEKHR